MTSSERLIDEFSQWLSVEKGRSNATIEAYRRDLAHFSHWMSARSLDLASLGESELEAYLGVLRDSALAASSIARAASSLRGWLGFLFAEGYISSDPSARLRSARRGRSLPKPLGEHEIARLLDSLSGDSKIDLRDRALLELLYGTGARVSEATGISLEDLDFDEELILVTGKGSKQRLVPMGASLKHALGRYLGPGGRAAFVGSQRHSRLFLNARGTPLSRQGVDLIIHRRALVAGIEGSRISAHVFRHSCATHMLAHGADIRVVQELLGHASIATTQVYTAVSVISLQREYQNAHPRAHE
ncbi:MAG TPA: tyrosine recombinase [Acidimicrobiales bacterium]|nr:tyrosine recombinase [Acidimicrobiales bacterium]